MLDPSTLDRISQRLADTVPQGLQLLKGDMQRNLRVTLENVLRDMSLVSRDEFEIQQAVLKRTRDKLEALEARVTALETANQPPKNTTA